MTAILLSGGVAACSAQASEDAASDEGAFTSVFDDAPLVPNGSDEPIAVPAAGTALTELTQPELLFRLEKAGYHFTNVVGARDRMTNAELFRSSKIYAGIVDALTHDVDELKQKDAALTTKVVTARNRLFDARWLKSSQATFDLVGVVSRLDRRDFQDDGRCGEVRLLYRLSYVTGLTRTPQFSRMPFFFNVVYDVPKQGCSVVARKWIAPSLGSENEWIQHLTRGPLALSALRLKQIEVNAQVVRMPSENKRDMGGHAEYFLRVFRPSNGSVVEAPLENTPDVARIGADAGLKAELLSWIKANVAGIDQGTALMPDKFAAKKATSFTTFGSVRTANKPFTKLFTSADFADVSFGSTKLLASPEALLFRLDDMTCTGCHQGRTVAGFHFLGKERGSRTNPLNGLRTHASPHYLADQPRREAYLRALASGRPTSAERPLSFAPPPDTAAPVGTHCVLAADAGHFKSSWSCADGTTCKALATNAKTAIDFGMCLPTAAKDGFAGLPCLGGAFTEGATPRADKLATKGSGCLGAYACLQPEEGTPGGMCVAKCKGTLGQTSGAHEICAYGGGAPFDACAMSGNFAACIDKAVRPAPRQACDEDEPCREDYMCQRLEPLGDHEYTTTPRTKGFCNPTYFIFQMRLDGHPDPGG